MFTTPHSALPTVSCRRLRQAAAAAAVAWGVLATGWCQAGPADAGWTAPSAYGLHPDAGGPPEVHDDPSLRIMVGTRSLPLSFSLIQPQAEWGAWADASQGPVMPVNALARGLPPPAFAEPTMRLWIPVEDNGQRMRFTHAYVNLTRPTFQDGDLQVRPGAGVVMQLGSGSGYQQQLSLGSVFRLNMGEGSQVSLRLKGGRLGVQYRLQFNL